MYLNQLIHNNLFALRMITDMSAKYEEEHSLEIKEQVYNYK